MPYFIKLLILLLKTPEKSYIIFAVIFYCLCRAAVNPHIFGAAMKAFEKLPAEFQNPEVKRYYDKLKKKSVRIFFKRLLDIFLSLILLAFLIIPIAVIAVVVKRDSKGSVFFRQKRVTKYGRVFRIFKFRTMVENAEALGTSVTTGGDSRITKAGKFLRKYRLDELPQIFNVISGDMSFVGVRPEVPKYVERYRDVYYATLLLPAGITSPASILYKDESKLLAGDGDADKIYVEQILPEKMKYNLSYIKNFGFFRDIGLMIKTVVEVIK